MHLLRRPWPAAEPGFKVIAVSSAAAVDAADRSNVPGVACLSDELRQRATSTLKTTRRLNVVPSICTP